VIRLLDASVRGREEELGRQFREGEPFRHVVIDPFLDAGLCGRLMAEFPAFDARYARNERGEPGGKAAVPKIAKLGAAYAQFDRLMRDREFLAFVGRITGIPGLLYDPE
jgi:hypothetical protein